MPVGTLGRLPSAQPLALAERRPRHGAAAPGHRSSTERCHWPPGRPVQGVVGCGVFVRDVALDSGSGNV